LIKEAIEKLVSLNPNPIEIKEIGDRKFSNVGMVEIKPPGFSFPDPVVFSQLSGLVYFAKDLKSKIDDHIMIIIENPAMVSLQGALQPKNQNSRFVYAIAQLKFKPFRFGDFMSIEDAVIGIQALFFRDGKCEAILDLLSNIADEQVVTLNDSGMSQKVHIKTGITTKSATEVPKTVSATPYRTFPEVEQVESDFILRFRKSSGGSLSCALFEADGGAWKIKAITDIASYLITCLKGEEIPVIA